MKYHNNQQVAIFDKENTLQDLLKKGSVKPLTLHNRGLFLTEQ